MSKLNLDKQTRQHLDGDFIELTDGITHYELKGGEGNKTIVLVHGNAVAFASWDNTIDDLVDAGFRVLRYDRFGHGVSDRPEIWKYDRELYDRQLVELLDKLGVTKSIYLVGTSQGGSVSIYFAAGHPERVEKIALLAPFFNGFDSSGAVLLKIPVIGDIIFRQLGEEKFIQGALTGLYSMDKLADLSGKIKGEYQYKGKKAAVLANLRGNALEDATEFYREVKNQGIPMMLTWGKQDQSISGESIGRLRKLIPEIEYHELDGAAHLAHYEFPDRINPLLVAFFKR